jgi:hypothetical protein
MSLLTVASRASKAPRYTNPTEAPVTPVISTTNATQNLPVSKLSSLRIIISASVPAVTPTTGIMPLLSANDANSKPCPKPRPTEGKLSFMTSQKPKPTGTRLPLSSPQKPGPTKVKLWPTSLVASNTTAEPVRSPIVPIHPVILTPNPPPPKPLTMIKARTITKPECSTRMTAIIVVFCASSKADWSYTTRRTPAVGCNVRCKATTTGSCAVATTFNSSTICCFSPTPPCGSKVSAFQALT